MTERPFPRTNPSIDLWIWGMASTCYEVYHKMSNIDVEMTSGNDVRGLR